MKAPEQTVSAANIQKVQWLPSSSVMLLQNLVMKKPMNQQNDAVKAEPLLFTFEANNSPTTAHVSEPKPETRDCLLENRFENYPCGWQYQDEDSSGTNNFK